MFHFGFECQHPLDPRKVQPLLGQLGDPGEATKVFLAVATAPATCACRLKEPFALVDAQGLGVDTGDLGGDRDDIDGTTS